MGKMIICSLSEDFRQLNLFFEKSFATSGEEHRKNLHIRVYKKLRINTENTFYKGEDFIFGTGTYIYRGKIGMQALENIYNDIVAGIFKKEDILGSFCIATYLSSELKLFIDSGATYDIYYYFNGERVIITNTYYHIAKIIPSRKMNENNLMAQWLQCAVIGNETVISDIYKLGGGQYLSLLKGQWSVCDDHILRQGKFYPDVWEHAKQIYRPLIGLFNNSAIFMTGGEDSRINYSIMKYVGMKPTLLYGVGDSTVTNTKKEDMDIVYQIAKAENLSVQLMNWKDSDFSAWEENVKKYGELCLIYSYNQNFISEFEEHIHTDFIGFGYFGEAYRNIESITKYKKEMFSIENFVDDLYVNKNAKYFMNEYELYRQTLIEQFRQVCIIREIDSKCIKRQDFQKLNTFYRVRADIVLNNFANLFFYSFPFLGNMQLLRNIENIDYTNKINSKYIMKGIKNFAPELMSIPYFSHINLKKLDEKTLELTEAYRIFEHKEFIRKHVHNAQLQKSLRKIYYLIKQDRKGKTEVEDSYKDKQIILQKLEELDLQNINLGKMVICLDASKLKGLLVMIQMLKTIC